MSLHDALGWMYRDLAARAEQRDPDYGVADLDAVLADQERPSKAAARAEKVDNVIAMGGEVA